MKMDPFVELKPELMIILPAAFKANEVQFCNDGPDLRSDVVHKVVEGNAYSKLGLTVEHGVAQLLALNANQLRFTDTAE
jgi:hypothetical protein